MGMREEYQAVMEKQLNEWKAQAERFKVGAGEMEAKAKVQYEKNLALLHAKQEVAWENFHKMKSASDSAWEQFKVHMENAGGELKNAAESMTNQFKK